MEYEFAPLEGITDAVYRTAHCRFYPGLKRYYTPFISPTKNHIFTPKESRELDPRNNAGVPLVPQLLGKNAEDIIWASDALYNMGYREVNLNFGCPSGTVLAKGKGAGMLSDPEALDRFLDAVFSCAKTDISVKTRLGVRSADEFYRVLEVYDRYPLCRLIIHPRTAGEMYTGSVHRDVFAYAAAHAAAEVSYNGDLFKSDDIAAFHADHPDVGIVMIGRGLVSDPGLIAGGGTDALRRFHEALCEQYPVVFGSTNSALHRMKAIWSYIILRYEDAARWKKRLIKTKRWDEFLVITDEILTNERSR